MSLTNYLYELGSSLVHLFFPPACASCNKPLLYEEDSVCLHCLLSLPYTNFHQYDDNALARQFWGLDKIEAAAACFYFNKNSKVQNLLHQVKYQRNKNAAVFLGRMYGNQLKTSSFSTCDFIIPIPLHPVKLKKRGYNQSELFAAGLAETMGIPLLSNVLIRVKQGESQTFKSRKDRFNMLKGVFEITYIPACKSGIIPHLLLVDDVITSGATLETCANLFLSKNFNVSLLSIAYAKSEL